MSSTAGSPPVPAVTSKSKSKSKGRRSLCSASIVELKSLIALEIKPRACRPESVRVRDGGIAELSFDYSFLPTSPHLDSHHHLHYEFPLDILFHGHRMIFFHSDFVDFSGGDPLFNHFLVSYHRQLSAHATAIQERYAWKPSETERISIDRQAQLVGFVYQIEKEKEKDAEDEDGDIDMFGVLTHEHDAAAAAGEEDSKKSVPAPVSASPPSPSLSAELTMKAQLTLFDCGKRMKEVSFAVLPKFQRRRIATDLVRVTWNLFCSSHAHLAAAVAGGGRATDTWIYVMNSRKSGAFWRALQLWYPEIKFKLERP